MEISPHARLTRGLRRWDVVALVINSIIGAGIFGLPSRVFALAGTYSLLAYGVSAVAIVLIILCFAEVGSRFKATGGPYLYARVAFGPLIGFQAGWLMWLSRIAAFAALCNLFIGYLGYFVPAASGDAWRAVVIVAMISALAAKIIVDDVRRPSDGDRHKRSYRWEADTAISRRYRRAVLYRSSPLFLRDPAGLRLFLASHTITNICVHGLRGRGHTDR